MSLKQVRKIVVEMSGVLVLHHTLATAMGSGLVCIYTLKLLCDVLKVDTTLATIDPVDWSRIESNFGVRIENRPKVIRLLPFKLALFSIYKKVAAGLQACRLRRKFNLVINTYGDLFFGASDILYLHFPYIAYEKVPALRAHSKYTRSLFWRLYYEPYRIMTRIFSQGLVEKVPIILTNSRFSKYYIHMMHGRDAIIVYPPIQVEEYLKLRECRDKEDAVLYLARFDPFKNQDVIPYIARELPHIKFYLVGAVYGRNREYFDYVRKLCERLNVRNVVLLPNLPHEEKLRVMAKCKVYIHLAVTEHFGIAPVEAMASGLALVVPKLSGTWTDVCDMGRYGLGFTSLNVSEIVPLVEDAISSWRQLQAPVEHVLKFSVQNFYRTMQCIISRLIDVAS